MNRPEDPQSAPQLTCGKCKLPLAPGKVTFSYMGSVFPVELWKCPSCGLAYVPESLAIGKILQAEQALEDK